MNEKELQFAKMLNEHERNIIESFNKNPMENVASVCLEVGGVEHIVLIKKRDYVELTNLLFRFNRNTYLDLQSPSMKDTSSCETGSSKSLDEHVGLIREMLSVAETVLCHLLERPNKEVQFALLYAAMDSLRERYRDMVMAFQPEKMDLL